jgi:hypothetical protein
MGVVGFVGVLDGIVLTTIWYSASRSKKSEAAHWLAPSISLPIGFALTLKVGAWAVGMPAALGAGVFNGCLLCLATWCLQRIVVRGGTNSAVE